MYRFLGDEKHGGDREKREIIKKVNQIIHEKVEAYVEEKRSSIEAELRKDGYSDEEIEETIKEIKRNLQVKMIKAHKDEIKKVKEEREQHKHDDVKDKSANLCGENEVEHCTAASTTSTSTTWPGTRPTGGSGMTRPGSRRAGATCCG